MAGTNWGERTQTLLDELAAQSSVPRALLMLASLSLVQNRLRGRKSTESLPEFIHSLAEEIEPPLTRCAVTGLRAAEDGENIVHLRWPFFGSATIHPFSFQIVITPRAHPPSVIDWVLPDAWDLVDSLPPPRTPEELVRLAERAAAIALAADAALRKRRASLVENASSLRTLTLSDPDPVAIELLAGLEFPLLHTLEIASPAPLLAPVLGDLPSIEVLTIEQIVASSALFVALAELPLWRRVRVLRCSFIRLEHTVDWSRLWSRSDLQFESIHLRCTETEPAIELVRSPLARLRTLSLSGVVRDSFLEALAAANLPALEDLDLSLAADITPGAVRTFVRAGKPGLPKLRRLGIDFASGRREDYVDWGGAVVDSGFEPMTPAELHDSFLAGSDLTLLPGS